MAALMLITVGASLRLPDLPLRRPMSANSTLVSLTVEEAAEPIADILIRGSHLICHEMRVSLCCLLRRMAEQPTDEL